jgi:hypothetical protein
MKRFWLVRGLKFVLFAVVAAAVVGAIVMVLWNALMPALFGLPSIGFWQGLGLFVLSKILLGGFGGRSGRHLHWRGRMRERWDQMTDEERATFRDGLRRGCGGRGAVTDSKA